jgi:hypothetical protein
MRNGRRAEPLNKATEQSREPEHSITGQLKSKSSVRARLRQTFVGSHRPVDAKDPACNP